MAAAASLKREYTIPDGTQTVIITRVEGRTPVPEQEQLRLLAQHRSSLAIFLSVGLIHKVAEELSQHYPPDTPVAVVEKASWPEERVVKGRLQELADMVTEAGIKKTALILVGEFLSKSGSPNCMIRISAMSTGKNEHPSIAILCLTKRGRLAHRLAGKSRKPSVPAQTIAKDGKAGPQTSYFEDFAVCFSNLFRSQRADLHYGRRYRSAQLERANGSKYTDPACGG